MNIYRSFNTVPPLENAVLALGTFDGMHLAHRHLVEKVCQEARKIKGQSVIISFLTPPRKTISADFNHAVLTTQDEKTKILSETGLNNLIIIDFTPKISNMNYADCINFLQTKIGIKKIILGYNHHFGKNREGNFFTLQQLGKEQGFEVEEIEKQTIDGLTISSSAIRQALQSGDIVMANRLLGYNYSVDIQVFDGENNFRYDKLKLLPKNGRYAVKINELNCILTVDFPHLLLDNLEVGKCNIEFLS